MQPPEEARPRPRQQSAFVAAFLSLIFPGLGHAYARAWTRAIGFAAPPLLLLALLLGVLLKMGPLDTAVLIFANLGLILVANVVALIYRAVVAIDAYRVVAFVNAQAEGDGRLGRRTIRLNPLSVAGLAAVCLVIAGAHVVVAEYGGGVQSYVACIQDPDCDTSVGSTPNPSDAPISTDSPTPTLSLPPVGTALPSTSPVPTWNGTDRLNILLLGVDQRAGDSTFNTDTMIVVSIDPVSKNVALFSIPRDTVDVPLPAAAQGVFGSVYQGKINSLWTNARNRPDAFPGTGNARGYNALKETLGTLYHLNIQYYVMVNFQGFKKVVDTLGGVTIDVQNPVVDDRYPADDGTDLRVYIPAGVQHMTGAQALVYARSRHGSNDFDRASRQQRVILSIRQQANPQTVLANLSPLLDALKSSFKTDIPITTNVLPELIQLSSQINTANIRSYVFSPPRYGTEGYPGGIYSIEPNVALIRSTVANAFKIDPKLEQLRDAVSAENGTIWVVNGSGKTGQANTLVAYLEYEGLTAVAQTQRPPALLAKTQIKVYNGREDELPATVALLEKVFGVTATFVTDPSVTVDIIVTTGKATATLTPPPGP
jgi:LCP family protein required for cell wall assembly